MHRGLLLAIAATAHALSTATAAPKQALRSLFSKGSDGVLVDPIEKAPLARETVVLGGEVRARYVSASGAAYTVKKPYVDLLPTSGRSAPLTLDELQAELLDAWESRTQTQLFRSPLTSFLYERGWRDGFKRAGFPGIEKEFEEVQAFFQPVAGPGGVVVDMSCGSGLMTRRLLRSGAYGRVLALDYSESMLLETARRVREEAIPAETLTLCRADVAALPLAPGSIDALHAGAAMHCWPRLEDGLTQIRASLRPGGRFFATTFFQGAYGAAMPRQSGGSFFRFFEDEDELTRLLIDAGFPEEGVVVRREGRGCAIIRCEVGASGTEEAAAATDEAAAATEEVAAAMDAGVESGAPSEAEVPLAEVAPQPTPAASAADGADAESEPPAGEGELLDQAVQGLD